MAKEFSGGVASRIRARLRDMGLSEREASRRAGFSQGYVGDVLSGRSKEPAMPRMIKLASALECDVGYLIGSQDLPRVIKDGDGIAKDSGNQSKAQRLIDLYSAPSLSDSLWVQMLEKAVDKVPVIPPLAHVDGAYAWSICTRHMEPRYYVGEVVYLHPGLVPRIGDFVLAKKTCGLVGVARLLEFGKMVTFGYLTGQTCTVDLSAIEFIHRIVGSAG